MVRPRACVPTAPDRRARLRRSWVYSVGAVPDPRRSLHVSLPGGQVRVSSSRRGPALAAAPDDDPGPSGAWSFVFEDARPLLGPVSPLQPCRGAPAGATVAPRCEQFEVEAPSEESRGERPCSRGPSASTKSGSMCGRRLCISACAVVSLLLIILGVGVLLGFDHVFRYILNKEVSLSEHSRAFPMWKDVNHETKIRFFFFNVTNPNEVLIGEKPSVKEVGPYTYRADWVKHNITFHDNGTMSYKETKRYYFDRQSSVGPESDEIMTVNVPFVTTAQLLKEQNFIIRGIASLSLSGLGQRIFISRSVGQLTFGGYPDILVLLGSVIDSGRPRPGQPGFNIGDVFSHGYRTVIDMLGSLVDPDRQGTNGKFGYMVNKNDTVDGEYTIFTGEDDISKVNKVYEFNKHRKLDVWQGDECNTLTGTLGHIRPPLSKSNEQVVFIPDICRSIPTENVGYESFKGLKVKRFIAGPTAFDSGQLRSENECFAAGRTLPDGGANLGPCKQGAPLVLSFPHFLYADSSYRADVDGMNPDPKRHQFFFHIEPTLGVTVNVRGRIQVSVVLERVFGLGPFSRVAEGVLPLFWQETRVEARDGTVKLLRTIVQLPEYSQWGSVGLIVISSLLLAASTFLLFRPRVTRREITKVQPIAIDVKKSGDATCTDMFPTKVERILQNGLDRLPNSFGITAVRNNFINELKNTRRTSEPSAPADIDIYKT
ncbi:scavenger receptor class B member 1-like isoform X1 [Dermacentor variabilis]|uniref:scavenger receptor class B member 1-like isoform X1 n=1 Tax=Dermacentor variabilis TaxID=34621 RepID=UPI003F5C1E29